MIKVLFILGLLRAGMWPVPLPGTPVDAVPFQDGFAVACSSPGGVYHVISGEEPALLPITVEEPGCIALWNGRPAVSDRACSRVAAEGISIPVPGVPEGICATSGGDLLVCLFDSGELIEVAPEGSWRVIARVPGAKSVQTLESGGFFASGCGSGVFHSPGSGVVPVGNIGAGVKRLAVILWNEDDLPDALGVACAEGGAGVWVNPGDGGDWEYTGLWDDLQGPKDIFASGDSVIIASLFSPLEISYLPGAYPGGFQCCAFSGSATAAGHSSGFLVWIPHGTVYSN